MGKERSWVGANSSKRGGGAQSESASTPGCMCAMFHQLFDFHQFSFALHQQQPSFEPTNSFLPELPPTPRGAEAPRNSLELEEPSLPVSIKEEDDLNIPIGIQIRTKGNTLSKVHGAANDCSSSSDISSSPATKTPTLVARLMGLDLLPDQSSSPRLSSSSTVGTPHHEGNCVNQHLRPRHSLQGKSASHRSSLDGDWRGTRSLPETPRVSSARRSDVEHRLSLQINKENMSIVKEESVISHISLLKTKGLKAEEESRSPGHYARQIVKQVKESVSRRVGLDITNTERSREQGRRDQELVSQLKSKKLSKALTRVNVDVSSLGKHSSSPVSSRLKSIDPKNKPITSTVNSALFTSKDHYISQLPKQPLMASSQVNILSSKNSKDFYTNPTLHPVEEFYHHRQQRPINKVTGEKFGPPTRLKKLPQTKDVVRNKQEEPFVRPTTASRATTPDKKCKKNPLSNDILQNITVPNLLPVKKVPTPPATKLPIKQVLPNIQESKRSSQLSSCSSQSYKTGMFNSRDSCNDKNNHNEDRSNGSTTCTTTGGGAAEEYEYISRILRRTGIDKDTPVSCTRWFSPSHPLDPSIFYLIEHLTSSEKYASGLLGHRCNRRLLFNLVDEMLVDILRPFINMKPWAGSSIARRHSIIGHMKGSHLVETLCSRVGNFPRSDCLVLEDIDNLIDKDLPQVCAQTDEAFEEEGEGIAVEIEKDIIDTLIQETAVAWYV